MSNTFFQGVLPSYVPPGYGPALKHCADTSFHVLIYLHILYNATYCCGYIGGLGQESPNYGPRSLFIRPQRHFVNIEKIIYSRNICCFGRM